MDAPRTPQQGLDFLASRSPSTVVLGLDRMHEALEELGHPELRLRSVQVGGTNGKGSTCAFLDSILRAAGHEEVAVAGDHGMTGADDGGEPRRAEPVDGDARDRVRQAREQRGEAGDVAVVLARLVGAAEPDVLDLVRGDSRALHGSRDRERRKVVGPDGGESASVAADGSAHGRQHDRPGHCASSSAITRCAIAKAPFAAGTPQ